MKKTILAVLAASMMLGMSMPAAAETFTAANGVLSIDLPDENWKEIVDPTKWIALSDGSNEITIEHYSNGEKLPDMTVADSHYVNVYQGIFSTQNEVFLITGSVVDAAKISEIANAIVSLKVLQYDTKVKVKQEETVSVSEFSVSPMDQTMYVTSDGLNVRNGCSTNEQIIGALAYGSSVHVTGSVQRNGQDFGWYAVSYGNGTGYVSASFLSKDQPAAKEGTKAEEKGITFTGNAKTVYAVSGAAITIYEATDGHWYDSIGAKYDWVGNDNEVMNETGDHFSTSPKSGQTYFTGAYATAYTASGTPYTIRENTDGYWYTDTGMRMTWIDGNKLQSESGEVFTTTYVSPEESAGQDLVQCEYCGEWFLPGNEFRNHICPARDAAYAAEAAASDNSDQEMVQCEYCGNWFTAGNEFRNHICPARDAAYAEGN